MAARPCSGRRARSSTVLQMEGGCAPQFGSSLDPSSFNIAVVLFVGGLAERRQTLGKNDAKNQTIVNVS